MTLYFSADKAGFFDDTVHTQLPADAVAITKAAHIALMQAQTDGMQIVADDQGYPIAVPPPAPSEEQLLAALRADRDARLASTDYLMMPDYPISTSQRQAWAEYRQSLRDLPETITDPADIEWPIEPKGTPHE